MSQFSFSTLFDGHPSDQEAKEARKTMAKKFRKQGRKVSSFTLKNQVRPYSGFGQPDGRSCNVYMLNVL